MSHIQNCIKSTNVSHITVAKESSLLPLLWSNLFENTEIQFQDGGHKWPFEGSNFGHLSPKTAKGSFRLTVVLLKVAISSKII